MEYLGDFVALPSQQWQPADLQGPGISRRVSPLSWECFFSTTSQVCRRCALQPDTKGGELWDQGGHQAPWLCFCQECQLPGNCGCAPMLCPCPAHWAQQQLVLPTPAGMLFPAEGRASHSPFPPLSHSKLWAASMAPLSSPFLKRLFLKLIKIN